ncbi:hypothetical protein DH2020_042720 [Rehmannia glutinosa]|uniref:Uncharacterized protein n=1 Tax=Rehmannia glutinosa TaxID=99300 RepID=A0ABR0UMX7_REHGL
MTTPTPGSLESPSRRTTRSARQNGVLVPHLVKEDEQPNNAAPGQRLYLGQREVALPKPLGNQACPEACQPHHIELQRTLGIDPLSYRRLRRGVTKQTQAIAITFEEPENIEPEVPLPMVKKKCLCQNDDLGVLMKHGHATLIGSSSNSRAQHGLAVSGNMAVPREKIFARFPVENTHGHVSSTRLGRVRKHVRVAEHATSTVLTARRFIIKSKKVAHRKKKTFRAINIFHLLNVSIFLHQGSFDIMMLAVREGEVPSATQPCRVATTRACGLQAGSDAGAGPHGLPMRRHTGRVAQEYGCYTNISEMMPLGSTLEVAATTKGSYSLPSPKKECVGESPYFFHEELVRSYRLNLGVWLQEEEDSSTHRWKEEPKLEEVEQIKLVVLDPNDEIRTVHPETKLESDVEQEIIESTPWSVRQPLEYIR